MKVVHLYGSWDDMGRQYGEQLNDELHHVYNFLKEKAALPSQWKNVEDVAEKLFSKYPDELRSFFQGMSATSGFSEKELRIINAVEYSEAAFMCSGIAAWGDYTRDGQLMYARNYDEISYQPLCNDLVVTVYHPTGCQWVATLGYAGEIYALNGINESGIFIELNNGMPSGGFEIDYDIPASTTELLMMLFRVHSLDDVDRFFHETKSFASFVIGVADKHEARSYEWCSKGVKRGDGATPEGLMIQTNHYVNPEWDFAMPDDAVCWSTLTRRCHLLKNVEKHKGNIDLETMKQFVGEDINDGGVMFNNVERNQPATMYQFVVIPETKTFWIHVVGIDGWQKIELL